MVSKLALSLKLNRQYKFERYGNKLITNNYYKLIIINYFIIKMYLSTNIEQKIIINFIF